MAVSFLIDSEQQVVFTQVVGVVDSSQLHEHQDRLRDNPCFQPNMHELIDCTGLKHAKLRSIITSRLVKGSPWRSSSRRAIVVHNSLAFGLLKMFQTLMSDAHGEISIFHDIDSAKRWLDL
jgi:hypothetical protein